MDDGEARSLADATCILRRAMLALAVGDVDALELFTEDVVVDSPILRVWSRTELGYQLLDRAEALSNVEFDVAHVEMTGADTAVATWSVAGDHTGGVLFNDDVYFAPSGRRIHLSGTTRALFRERRIAAVRTTHDHGDLFEQIRGGLSPDGR